MTLSANHRAKPSQRSRATLVWGIGLFFAVQIGLAFVVEFWRQELRDPEYGHKRNLLHEALAQNPDRPLLLFLGSSRTSVGVRPEVLADAAGGDPRRPLAFNMGISGAGPVMELVTLRRLLADGVRPRWVVLEILAPKLNLPRGVEISALDGSRLGWCDFQTARQHESSAAGWQHAWTRSRAVPAYFLRYVLLSWVAPAWLPWDRRQDHLWSGIDRSGWMRYPKSTVDAEEYRRGLRRASAEYKGSLQDLEVTEAGANATQELIDECRRHDIEVALLLMPESRTFRSWYSQQTTRRLYRYLRGLCAEQGLRLIDARRWVDDTAFSDGHHLLPDGALRFSRRLVCELFAAPE